MRIIIKPMLEPNDELDVTDAVIEALANALSDAYEGGNEVLNRLEAEHHLLGILDSRAVFHGGRTVRATAGRSQSPRSGAPSASAGWSGEDSARTGGGW